MPWNAVTAQWHLFVDQLCVDFRFLEPAALVRFRGDRLKMVTYLAETHDLTEREACETLKMWFERNGRTTLETQAA
ncbi:hypothetical protein [Aestuariibius sp. HNIBRBA575]|uniref:hypothetical protein n=1 Tax=Aestuariibius sp. HNIBRBA575 TaxID=3233343 RepID=UPI0034A125AC